jgi:hypothetical protein
MLNATLCATERTICCLLENCQTPEGIRVPPPLQPYLAPYLKDPSIIPYKYPAPKKRHNILGEVKTVHFAFVVFVFVFVFACDCVFFPDELTFKKLLSLAIRIQLISILFLRKKRRNLISKKKENLLIQQTTIIMMTTKSPRQIINKIFSFFAYYGFRYSKKTKEVKFCSWQ